MISSLEKIFLFGVLIVGLFIFLQGFFLIISSSTALLKVALSRDSAFFASLFDLFSLTMFIAFSMSNFDIVSNC